MKKLQIVFFSFIFLLTFSACAQEKKLKVVCSTLDFADFAKAIGGDIADVYAISEGDYDLHFFQPKPSQLLRLKKADMLIAGGLGIDPWLTGMIDASRNPRINFGGSGFVDPSSGVKAIQIPEGKITGEMGDVHPYGNPHYWYDPVNMGIILDNILKGFVRIAPDQESFFTENKNKYQEEIMKVFEDLKKKLEPFRGAKMLQFHKSWDYFCNTFGLTLAGSVEPKPGIPPSAGFLETLIERIKTEKIELIIAEPYYSAKPLAFLQNQTGIKVLRLPFYLGSKKEISSFIENMKYNVNEICKALSEKNE